MNRCDRCGAPGIVEWSGPGGFLTMCKHHSAEHALKLTASGFAVVRDISETLLVKP